MSTLGVPNRHSTPVSEELTLKAKERPRKRTKACSVNCSTGTVADLATSLLLELVYAAPGNCLVSKVIDTEGAGLFDPSKVTSGINRETNTN